jgi:aryl-alcohol dehydrogenase-like predicted oxidoreductase
MGLNYGINNKTGAKVSFDDSCEILLKAFEIGIDTLDTAEVYGDAHIVIGDFHKKYPQIKFNVNTKVPSDIHIEEIEQRIFKYLFDLNVSFINVLMFHSYEIYKKNKKVISVLEKLKSEGFIKHIGVSLYTNEEIQDVILDNNISVIQMPFNMLDNTALRGDLMKLMKSSGKIIHTRSAFLQGLFFKNPLDKNMVVQKLCKELTNIQLIAEEDNTTVSNLSLSYCTSNEFIDQVLIGVESIDQLLDNFKALDYKIKLETINKINKIRVENINLLNPSLWN